jgi:hypothetical protein
VQHADDPGFLPKEYRSTGQDLTIDLAKWRAICGLFSDIFLSDDGSHPFLDRLQPHLTSSPALSWTAFQGDFQFGSALAILFDMAASTSPEIAERLRSWTTAVLKEERALPELMAVVEEPLTPLARAALGRQAILLDNYLRYFRAHQGTMGGQLWQGLEAQCQCGIHSVARLSILWRSFLRDPRLIEEGHWPAFYTHQEYAIPRFDESRRVWASGIRGDPSNPLGLNMPARWAITSLTRHPLEKTLNNLDSIIARLSGEMQGSEAEQMQALLGQKADVVVPLFLALGWYDPQTPAVQWEEIPPSGLFDVEGRATLKSDWSETMTDVTFLSGVRDVTYRTQPNHLLIFKAGRMLMGTPVRDYDHGTPTQSWANTVVVGEGLPPEWSSGTGYARMEERIVIRRAAPEVMGYLLRDFRSTGIVPQTYTGWFHGGHSGPGMFDLVLHSHTWHPFVAPAQIIAYETHPEFDYVAGDATNAWPAHQVREMVRQVVFIRPDVIVVFDRVTLGEDVLPTRWIAHVPNATRLGESEFLVRNGTAYLYGKAVLPEHPAIQVVGGSLLEIRPTTSLITPRYLVVLRTGIGDPQNLPTEAVTDREHVGVRFRYGAATYTVLFRAEGPVGGRLTQEKEGKPLVHELTRRVELTLRNWKSDPRYPAWTEQARFRFFVPPADRSSGR